MKFLILALTLILTQSVFAKTVISCNQGNSVFLKLETLKAGTITGTMNHNYNGALLACKLGSLEELKATGEMKCVGLWNMAFNQNGEVEDKAVIITVIKKKDGKIQATFSNNWDERSEENGKVEVLDCE